MIPAFKGKKYKKNGETWTKAYYEYRIKYGLCNSPMAWAIAKKQGS
jgi:hypothetical protein